MQMLSCALVGAPVQTGTRQPGCLMGPDAMRAAGLEATLTALGHDVFDLGDVSPAEMNGVTHTNPAVRNLDATTAWALALEDAAYEACRACDLPIFLGGDHSLSIGTVPGVARYSNEMGRRQYVLWLDAHPDFHTLETTRSGNLHGTPVAYFTAAGGFDAAYPELKASVPAENVCMIGIRSVDPAEREMLAATQIEVHDMRAIDEYGIKAPLTNFLERIRATNGALHVSFDVDFLEPSIAPAVGTIVPGGATFREAHLVMELLCESELVTSLDLVELNPFLDERGRTTHLMVDLCASLFGRTVLDHPTRSR